jgi:hypothetical protein
MPSCQKDFDQVTAFAPENVKIAGVRIALQPLLDLQRQAVHAAPHVGVADRQPHPHPREGTGIIAPTAL